MNIGHLITTLVASTLGSALLFGISVIAAYLTLRMADDASDISNESKALHAIRLAGRTGTPIVLVNSKTGEKSEPIKIKTAHHFETALKKSSQ